MHEAAVVADIRSDTRGRRQAAPHRRCVVSGRTLPRERLIRFVVGPDDTIVPDLAEQLPGRGLWLTGRNEIVRQACDAGAFRRAARRAVRPLAGPNGEDLATLVDSQLARQCLDALGLARRAGALVVGFERVRAALKEIAAHAGKQRISAMLLTAEDGAADGREKLRALAARANQNGAAVSQLALFDAHALGQAIGRDDAVHVLVRTDIAGGRLHTAFVRLAAYRGLIALADGEGVTGALGDVVEMD